MLQDDGDDGCIQRRCALDGHIDHGRGFGHGRVAEAAERAVGFHRGADIDDQGVGGSGPAIGGLDNHPYFCAVLIVIAQGRHCDIQPSGLAVAQDDHPCWWDPLRQDLNLQDEGGTELQPRMPRGEHRFAIIGHLSPRKERPRAALDCLPLSPDQFVNAPAGSGVIVLNVRICVTGIGRQSFTGGLTVRLSNKGTVRPPCKPLVQFAFLA